MANGWRIRADKRTNTIPSCKGSRQKIMVQQIPTLEFNWMWIKDKKIYFNSIPYTQNHHIVVVDEEDEVCGFWLIERIERHERE